MILPAVTQGHSGLVVADAKEAQSLATGTTHLSPHELGALVFSECALDTASRPAPKLEFPCMDSKGARLLSTKQWSEAVRSPVRFLKAAVQLGNDDIVQIWGKNAPHG